MFYLEYYCHYFFIFFILYRFSNIRNLIYSISYFFMQQLKQLINTTSDIDIKLTTNLSNWYLLNDIFILERKNNKNKKRRSIECKPIYGINRRRPNRKKMYCPSNRDEFECKPDECVKWSFVCDGIAHCSNRADEDCGNNTSYYN